MKQLFTALNYLQFIKKGQLYQIQELVETMTEKVETKLFSELEAANYFGWSVFTMREIRKRGEIEHLLFQEKTVRYTLEQLEKYKARHLKLAA
jgi:hypothetical protein